MTHKLIHEFDLFSISRTAGGDYVAEMDWSQMDEADEILLISPNGSAEHEREIHWIEDPKHKEADFLAAYPEIRAAL